MPTQRQRFTPSNGNKQWFIWFGRILLIGALAILLGERAMSRLNGGGGGANPALPQLNQAAIARVEVRLDRMDEKLDRLLDRVKPPDRP